MSNHQHDGPVTLSAEEHKARAMLMGMVYHNNNGDDPFYFKYASDGTPDTCSMIDAVTLEPLVFERSFSDGHAYFDVTPKGKRAHTNMWSEFGRGVIRK